MIRARVAGGLLLSLALGGCVAQPRFVAGVPQDDLWVALPLGAWAGEERGTPEALAACLPRSCQARIAVGLFSLRGELARASGSVLDNPGRLVAELAGAARNSGRGDPAQVTVESLSESGLRGFRVQLRFGGEAGGVLHGAALGRREGEEVRVAFGVGEDAVAVEAAVRQLAAQNLPALAAPSSGAAVTAR